MAAPKSLLKGFERTVATIKPDPAKRLTVSDPDTRGLYLRVTPAGHKSYVVVARDPGGKQVWATIGDCDDHSLAEARELAGEGVRRIRKGLVAFPKTEPEKAPETFKAVAENFIERHVKKQALRSAGETQRILETYVYPAWGERAFLSIRRADVATLLDKLEDGKAGASGTLGGPVMADRTLAALSKLFSWYQARDDDYVSPVVRGMRRTNAKDRARSRILSDDEIRVMWTTAECKGAFGAFLKLLLLTAQRRAKVAAMKWADVEDGVWTLPTEDREKGNPGALKLPALALEVMQGISPVKDNPFVFAGRGKVAMAMSDKLKKDFDEAAGLADWTLHDLRRTARSLMSRAGVRPDHSERVLGHVIAGVEGVYDRHSYSKEKGEALEALAGLVALILDPPADNVFRLGAAS
ncbi:MAG: integrase family protein [Blastomonas sp.]|uniref:tyrosine-type recombinase/integrase n=1 Tax=Blastomonas sp. TaxID=1909299 RepID=UPI003BE244C8|nr:integrase family protein [Blastomonas sp.]